MQPKQPNDADTGESGSRGNGRCLQVALACHANNLQLNIIKQIRMPLTDQIDLMCHDVACCILNFAEHIAALIPHSLCAYH